MTENLPTPPGWPRRDGRIARAAGRVIGVVAVGVFVVVTLGALGARPADLQDPGALLADLVAVLRAGPVPWTGAVGAALVLLAPAVTAGAGRPERERLLEDGPGRWVLRFRVATDGLWRSVLYGLGAMCLFLVWVSDVVGGGTFFSVAVVLLTLVGTGPLVVRAVVATWWPHRRERVDLTAAGLERHTLRGVVSVAWSDVRAVEARARRRGENGTRLEVVLLLHGRAGDPPRWSIGSASHEIVVPAAGFAVPAERLYWACVVFLDPVRREALLNGTSLTVPAPR